MSAIVNLIFFFITFTSFYSYSFSTFGIRFLAKNMDPGLKGLQRTSDTHSMITKNLTFKISQNNNLIEF